MLGSSSLHAQTIEQPTAVWANEFVPPHEYREWYSKMERCVGVRGSFESIVWAVTEKPWRTGIDTTTGRALYTYGQWTSADSGRALILLQQQDWRNESYVEHEMLHDILWRSGWKMPVGDLPNVPDTVNIRVRHPAPPYERCAPTYIEQMRLLEQQRHSPWKQVYRP